MSPIDFYKKLSVQVAISGGILTYILINSVPYFLNKKIKQTEGYKEAMKMIKSHPEAIKYLGEPIEDGTINVTKKESYGSDEEKAWFRVPVKGPKSIGNVYCESKFVKKEFQKDKLELSRIELTLQSLPGYKLLIKKPE